MVVVLGCQNPDSLGESPAVPSRSWDFKGRNCSMGYSHTNAKGITYLLNAQKVTLRNNREQVIHYFAKVVKAEAAACELPENFVVLENAKTGLPYLKRSA